MKSFIKLSLVALTLFISACSSFHKTHESVEPVAHTQKVHLDKDIQKLLQQEMKAIELGAPS